MEKGFLNVLHTAQQSNRCNKNACYVKTKKGLAAFPAEPQALVPRARANVLSHLGVTETTMVLEELQPQRRMSIHE